MSEEVPSIFIELLRSGYAVRSQAKGMSMTPFIRPGDVLTVEPAPLLNLQVGDIAVFAPLDETTETLTSHRVVRAERRAPRPFVETRSDAEGWSGIGEIVFPEQIYGRVVRVEREGVTVWNASRWTLWLSGAQVRLRRSVGTFRRLIRRAAPPNTAEQRLSVGAESDVANRIYKPENNILFRPTASRAFLIPIRSGTADMEELLMLNPTGAHLWSLLDGRRSVREIVRSLTESFEITAAEADADVRRWLEELWRLRLVRPN